MLKHLFEKNFLTSEKKKKILYFIYFNNCLKQYRESLQSDHEAEEIEEQVKIYTDIAKSKAKLVSSHTFAEKSNFSEKSRLDEMILSAISYALDYSTGFSVKDICEMFRDYVKLYGDVPNTNKIVLKATIQNDRDLISIFSKQ